MEDNNISECPRCGGSGKCIECGGAGFTTCASCGGTGEVKSVKCSECSGKGKIECSPDCEVCSGKGVLEFQPRIIKSSEKQEDRQVYVAFIPKKPVVSLSLIALSFLLTLMSGMLFGSGNKFFEFGVFYSPWFLEGQLWRIITAMFLHGSPLHLLFNMYCLYILGPTLEQILGRIKFLSLYFVSGVTGFVVSMIFMPDAFSVGASGALFGVMTAYFALYLRFRLFDRVIINQLLFWVAVNFAFGLFVPNINMWAHLGGGIAGFLYIYTIRLLRR